MSELKYETHIVYKIYKIEHGLLIEPTTPYDDNIFSEYDTQDDACKAINNYGKGTAEYVVLPIAVKSIHFED